MAIVVPQTLVNLLSYFRTGDKPTQDEFEELIRTFFHNYQEAMDAAAAAVATAEAAAASVAGRAPKVLAHLSPLGGNWELDWSVGIASFDDADQYKPKLNFTTPFADAKYIAQICWDTAPPTVLVPGGSVRAVTASAFPYAKAAGYIQLNVPVDGPRGFGLVCWDGR